MFWITDPEELSTPHKVWDLSITDPDERAALAQVFPTALAAAAWLGVPPREVLQNRCPGCKVYSFKHEKVFAIRKMTK